jgi:hypothetical protein
MSWRARRQEGNNVPIDATNIGNDALAASANDPLAALSVHRALLLRDKRDPVASLEEEALDRH